MTQVRRFTHLSPWMAGVHLIHITAPFFLQTDACVMLKELPPPILGRLKREAAGGCVSTAEAVGRRAGMNVWQRAAFCFLKTIFEAPNRNFISTGAAVSLIETGRQETVLRVLEPAITLMVELQLNFERCSLGAVRHMARAPVGCMSSFPPPFSWLFTATLGCSRSYDTEHPLLPWMS